MNNYLSPMHTVWTHITKSMIAFKHIAQSTVILTMQKYFWKIVLDFFLPNRTNAIGFGSSNDDKANFNMIFARQKMEYNMYYVQEIVIKASKKAFLKMCKTSESNILVTNMIWQMQSVLAPPHLLLLKRKSERCDNASQGTFDFEFSRSET